MQKYKIFSIILSLAVAVQLVSCTKAAVDDPAQPDARLALAFLTRGGGGDLVLGGEDEFTSLAVYLFNDGNGNPEFSELVTDFTPASAAASYTKSVHVTPDKKAVYAIANYAGHTFTAAGQPVTLAGDTPKAVLDALEVASAAFSDATIPMVGKKTVEMSSVSVSASMEMERLVGRVDMHVYKTAALEDDVVELVSIEFRNQVGSSNVQYQSMAMPAGDIRRTETYTPLAATYLGVVPGDAEYAALGPEEAEKSFYSYQNISGSDVPDDAVTPYLLVNVKVNGAPVTYRGDLKNTAGLYDLERNKVYRVKALVGEPNGMLYLRVDVLKWDAELSAITYEDRAAALSGLDDGANAGEVSLTQPATYDFALTAPEGAVWSASLTNGLDFRFASGGGYASQGIARPGAYAIRIEPTRSFSANDARETGFYISVDGEKVRINPNGAGGSYGDGRKYPGTETEILIKQIP